MKKNKIQLIIDTDIGGDPDDLLAIILAIVHPEVEIKAFVTNDEFKGNCRAQFLEKVISVAGIKTSIFSGVDLGNSKDFIVSKMDLPSPSKIKSIRNFCSDTIADIIYDNPGIKYLSLGALSNIYNLAKSRPDIINKFDIYQMGGAINYRKPDIAEHNIRLDTKASRFIIRNFDRLSFVISDTTFIPADLGITKESSLLKRMKLSKNVLYRLFVEHCNLFFERKYSVTIPADPITLLSIVLPDILSFRKVPVMLTKDCRFIPDSSSKLELNLSSKIRDFNLVRDTIFNILFN